MERGVDMAIDYDDPKIIQDANEKLAEMYSKADRAGRIKIGRGLGMIKIELILIQQGVQPKE